MSRHVTVQTSLGGIDSFLQTPLQTTAPSNYLYKNIEETDSKGLTMSHV
jgi:hypothetical protein